MISGMELDLRSMKMEIASKENFTEGNLMEEDFLFGEMEKYTRGNFMKD